MKGIRDFIGTILGIPKSKLEEREIKKERRRSPPLASYER